jgi:hypothetical protein
MGEPASVQCAQCKAPYAVFGVEPPLEYVCGDCGEKRQREAEWIRRMVEIEDASGPSLFAITPSRWAKQARQQG